MAFIIFSLKWDDVKWFFKRIPHIWILPEKKINVRLWSVIAQVFIFSFHLIWYSIGHIPLSCYLFHWKPRKQYQMWRIQNQLIIAVNWNSLASLAFCFWFAVFNWTAVFSCHISQLNSSHNEFKYEDFDVSFYLFDFYPNLKG